MNSERSVQFHHCRPRKARLCMLLRRLTVRCETSPHAVPRLQGSSSEPDVALVPAFPAAQKQKFRRLLGSCLHPQGSAGAHFLGCRACQAAPCGRGRADAAPRAGKPQQRLRFRARRRARGAPAALPEPKEADGWERKGRFLVALTPGGIRTSESGKETCSFTSSLGWLGAGRCWDYSSIQK